MCKKPSTGRVSSPEAIYIRRHVLGVFFVCVFQNRLGLSRTKISYGKADIFTFPNLQWDVRTRLRLGFKSQNNLKH